MAAKDTRVCYLLWELQIKLIVEDKLQVPKYLDGSGLLMKSIWMELSQIIKLIVYVGFTRFPTPDGL